MSGVYLALGHPLFVPIRGGVGLRTYMCAINVSDYIIYNCLPRWDKPIFQYSNTETKLLNRMAWTCTKFAALYALSIEHRSEASIRRS